MGFASPLLLALLGLSSVDAFWFGGMQEPPNLKPRGLQRRQMECSSGSTDCGLAGCISTAACCNAEAEWSCLKGNACYTVDGMVDCYTTTIPMPTVSRACYDYTQTGCRGGLSCFQCRSSDYGACVTTVLFGGSNTWLNCFTSSTIKTINVAPQTGFLSSTTIESPSSPSISSGPTTSRPTSPSRTTTDPASPSPTADKGGLSGGAIAGIVIGGFAVLTIAAVSLFLLFRKKPDTTPVAQQAPVPQAQPQPPYNGYQQPTYQDQGPYQQQPPYSPGPHYYTGAQGMQQTGGYPGVASPASPVYSEPMKQPTSLPAELGSH